jgi:hypothetical protein
MAYMTREHAPDPAKRPPQARPSEPSDVAHPAPEESRGCLFALSQPPLILFLTVIGALLLIAGAHDQFLL